MCHKRHLQCLASCVSAALLYAFTRYMMRITMSTERQSEILSIKAVEKRTAQAHVNYKYMRVIESKLHECTCTASKLG